MGRVGIKISHTELKAQIDAAEAGQVFKNESELFSFIVNTPWGKSQKDELGRVRELSPATIYQRVKQFNIPLKTVKGKRGNPNIGVKLTPEQKEEKIGTRPGYILSTARLKNDLMNHYRSVEGSDFKELPPNRLNLLKRHAKGNVRAAVKLKCLECCCWQAQEAAKCKIVGCPLYLINPFLKCSSQPELADSLVNEESDSNEGE
jgi:hypothetical protein